MPLTTVMPSSARGAPRRHEPGTARLVEIVERVAAASASGRRFPSQASACDGPTTAGGSLSRNTRIRSAMAGQSSPSQTKWLSAWLSMSFGMADAVEKRLSVGERDTAVGAGGDHQGRLIDLGGDVGCGRRSLSNPRPARIWANRANSVARSSAC